MHTVNLSIISTHGIIGNVLLAADFNLAADVVEIDVHLMTED
ncbi:hypothetical protein [Yoonia sp.]|jgi:hypothetical protein|nr:hypothetical protein [Yoonia sp.]MDE0852376.1 hypothetical protein [Yoonia sp.]